MISPEGYRSEPSIVYLVCRVLYTLLTGEDVLEEKTDSNTATSSDSVNGDPPIKGFGINTAPLNIGTNSSQSQVMINYLNKFMCNFAVKPADRVTDRVTLKDMEVYTIELINELDIIIAKGTKEGEGGSSSSSSKKKCMRLCDFRVLVENTVCLQKI